MPKQIEIPGTERPVIKEIEEAAENYQQVRDKRMSLTEKEITAKTNLIQVVLDHEKELSKDADGNRVYRYGDDMLVVLKPGRPNVRVKHAVDEEADED